MKRPWQVWLVFVLCVSGAAGAMVWLTQQALRTDAARRAAEADAALEQRVGLALWRMDTELAPIIAAEVIRAPSMYRAAFFAVPPMNLSQQQQLAQAPNMPAANVPNGNAQPQQAANVQMQQDVGPQASPLFVEPPAYVVCNFEATLDGRWRSPQVAEKELQSLAAANGVSSKDLSERAAHLHELATSVNVATLAADLPDATLPSIADIGDNNRALLNADSVARFNELSRGLNYYAGNSSNPRSQLSENESNTPQQEPVPQQSQVKGLGKGELAQMRSADFADRSRRFQSVAQQELLDQRGQFGNFNQTITPEDTSARIGVSRPIWIGQRLVLARRVEQAGKTFVQGCWLDWSKLKTRLLAEAVELVPGADLVAVPETTEVDPGRMLAGLPVRLVLNVTPAADAPMSPTLRWALWLGWGSLALAAAAAAALLAGVMALSERRAAFVSSVTHELRTPLTTFRMYSEMLARGMVPDGARRQEYLHTLQREAERLTHLVENVLSYARLERGRRPSATTRTTPAELFDRIGPRLAARAAHASMRCEIECADDCADTHFTTDPGVVEQILFNLVDNAAKYARAATDRRIHITARLSGGRLEFCVRDHGPGMPARRTSRLRPFAKTAEESAETAPGVGLGLALCGRLARQLGGRLDVAAAKNGAAVTLLLPTDR